MYRVAIVGDESKPYSNPKFHRVCAHAMRSKRMHLTPADVAFIEVCVFANMQRMTLSGLDNLEGQYRAALRTAKANLGRHVAAGVPTGTKPSVLVIGTGYVRAHCCLALCAYSRASVRRQRQGHLHTCYCLDDEPIGCVCVCVFVCLCDFCRAHSKQDCPRCGF